jgi:anti-sigma-K factor RskA
MKCENTQNLLAEYRSGTLPERHRRALEEHLQTCENCRHELHLLDAVLDLVGSNQPEAEPPIELWNGVYNRISTPHLPSTPRTRFNNWRRRPAHAAGIGIAALIVIAGSLIATHISDPYRNQSPIGPANNTYVQAHAYNAGHVSPVSDRVGYVSLVAAIEDMKEGRH